MRKIIDGEIYDTSTAVLVCDISPRGFTRGDFRYEATNLYKSPSGQFFAAGEGGPLSRWAHPPPGPDEYRSGQGLVLVSDAAARELCEAHGAGAA